MRTFLFAAAAATAVATQLESGVKIPDSWKVMDGTRDNLEGQKVQLTFAVKLSNKENLHDKLMSVSDPVSPSYGKLLTLDEVNQFTGPSENSYQTVKTYLSSFGINDVEYNSGFARATMPIEVAEKMLSAKYNRYRHSSGREALRCSEYHLPEEVAKVVDFVAPTVNFPSGVQVKAELVAASVQNTPDSLRALYNVNDVMGGASDARQACTAFLGQYYVESDLQAFYDEYFPELSGVPMAEVVGPNDGKAGVEASLDAEYMTVMGAGVPTEFWSFAGRQPGAPENEPFLDWLYQLGNTTNPPLVFSTSYGEDETSVSFDYASRMNDEFQKQALRGISFIFASGDSGVGAMSGKCDEFMAMFPSGSPYVTAVGATTKKDPEEGAGLSSGGFSNLWARPSWQDAAVAEYLATASDLPDSYRYNSTGRAFPDVSAQGTDYVVINGGKTLPAVAGTSASSPTFGGIIALVNDARIAAGKSPLGFLNPFIYANPSMFNDVTTGNNPGCGTPGFYAAAGWDPVTGVGTPDYEKIKAAALALP